MSGSGEGHSVYMYKVKKEVIKKEESKKQSKKTLSKKTLSKKTTDKQAFQIWAYPKDPHFDPPSSRHDNYYSGLEAKEKGREAYEEWINNQIGFDRITRTTRVRTTKSYVY